MADRLPAIDTTLPPGQRFPAVVRDEIAVVASAMVTKSSIGLGNVDNTSDLNKPLSSAAQEALNAKVTKIAETNKAYGTNSAGADNAWSISSSATSTTLALRGTGGTLQVGTATAANHAVTKAQLDAVAASGGVQDGGVTTAKIADGAVTLAKFANEVGPEMSAIAATEAASYVNNVLLPIAGAELGDGAVTTTKLGDLQVTSAKLADGAVNSSKIANGSVALVDLASSVQTSLGKADAALAGQNGATAIWTGTLAQLPVTGAAGVVYFVVG
ncbi:hypothetical protein SEA_SISKO_36 [Gordonia phage Sisko]|nr:minor tail protein [Gordonia phage AnClar]WIC90018.1 hypothetical protein SEA_SISKO_36 [Gordonia phage Sisko]